MQPSRWLAELLHRRGLERPDGRMLYGYRLNEEEYQTLREALTFSFALGRLDEVARRIHGFSALFVLYAAEWWRREYPGGAWRWTPIIQSFGGNAEDLASNARSECVVRGFAFWGHRPSGEGKKFFGAIVVHGGLPLKAIGNGAGKLAAIMAYVLRLAGRYRWDEAQMAEAVAERSAELPDSLRREEIYQLIARMVATILELKQEYRLAGVADPVAVLDEHDPAWRGRFPLPLEHDAAQALLSGLVREAAQQGAAPSSGVFAVERMLRLTADGIYELVSTLVCPPVISVDSLTGLFGLRSPDELPRYFSIDVQVGERQSFAEGRRVLGAETATVSLAAAKRAWRGADACLEHLVFLRGQAGELRDWPIAVPGGSELPQNDPWIFAMRDGKLRLLATGNARLPDEEALITLPAEWSIEADGTNSTVHPSGYCELDRDRMPIYAVRGDVVLRGAEQSVRVRTRQATDASDTYAWEGRRLGWPSSPQAVYVGLPRLFRYAAGGERSRIPLADLAWFVAGTKIPIADANTARGPVEVHLMQDSERVARFRFVVLDSASRTTFISGTTPNSGTIRLDGWGCVDVSMVEQPGVAGNIEQSDSKVELSMLAADSPPESVCVLMRWPRCTQELRLRLPFPSTGGRFFDGNGRSMKEGDWLALRNLLGCRLRVFDRNPQAPRRYDVLLRLIQPRPTLHGAHLDVQQEVQLANDGSAELRLIDLQKPIETLMGFSDELDAAVDVTLCVAHTPVTSIRVSRYEAPLERHLLAVSFPTQAIENFGAERLEHVIVAAVPLANPAREPVILEQHRSQGVPTALWQTVALDSSQAPWLIYPGESSSVFFRPTVWGCFEEQHADEPDGRCPLAKAMCIIDASLRMEAVAAVFEELAADFNHSSWRLVEGLWESFCHLPLSSLDAFRALAAQPTAAVALLLRSQLPDDGLLELSRRFRDELGMVWELTSIDMWREALRVLWSYWATLLGHDAAKLTFPIILRQRLERLRTELTSLEPMLDELLFETTGQLSEARAEARQLAAVDPLVFAHRLWRGPDCLAQTLLFRNHAADARWPEVEFFAKAWEGLLESATPATTAALQRLAKSLFWTQRGDFKLSVANLPVLCAVWAATGTSRSWWSPPQRRLALRKIRAFDPLWFDRAFHQAFCACIASGVLARQDSVAPATAE